MASDDDDFSLAPDEEEEEEVVSSSNPPSDDDDFVSDDEITTPKKAAKTPPKKQKANPSKKRDNQLTATQDADQDAVARPKKQAKSSHKKAAMSTRPDANCAPYTVKQTATLPPSEANRKAPAATPPAKATTEAATKKAVSADDAKKLVLEYMQQANRPYSAVNVWENLHKSIPKPALTKILDTLTQRGDLKSKTYGKSVIYFLNQEKLDVMTKAEMDGLSSKIQGEESDVEAIESKLKKKTSELNQLRTQLSEEELEKRLAAAGTKAEELQVKLQSLQDPSRKPISPNRKAKLKKQFDKYKKAWVERKRLMMDAIDTIADGMEKKPKAIQDMLELETDASAGVKTMPSI